jgi:ribosome-binding protein aMBF1 (putative translation factor)
MKYISTDTRCDMCEKSAKHIWYSKANDWEISLCDDCLQKMQQQAKAKNIRAVKADDLR